MALWEIKSPVALSHGFEQITPVEVLSEFDALLTFTFRDGKGVLRLAHLVAVGVGVSRYVVAKTDDITVAALKAGTISIRGALVRSQLKLIDVRADGAVVSVWDMEAEHLPAGALPEADVLLTDELEDEQLSDAKLARFARSDSDAEVAFDGGPVENHEIDAGFYGSFFQRANELFLQICKSQGVSAPVLRLGMTSPSSYAVDLHVEDREAQSAMFDEVRVPDAVKAKRAFQLFVSMIFDKDPAPEALTLVKTTAELRQQYGGVLELISRNGAVLSVRTRTAPRLRRVSGTEAGERLKRVREFGYPFTYLTVRGRLIGGFVEKTGRQERAFAIRLELTDREPEDLRGTVSEEAVEKMHLVKLGDVVEAKLQIGEDKDKQQTYTLVDIGPAADDAPHFKR